ncbi:aminotransferase class V-fold PLP-dependent enzyme [Pigmentibacter sp. JX0631]|uniref:threonine aldolase family protein n=1 Tax=Pigmentibacter sp. JX0631 TaxID=2976982 RepID=UPI0024683C6C|nr:aminotransferase class V-fold PLP-dependent enzyme [Pigmentibacter sp. JX0631]WGL58946.1 aminotransferase class V-fold PLP-dependent enzyme [Pigmentibacter sp. JX0631]
MQDTKIIQFASDNYVGAHPDIAAILMTSLESIEIPYGSDTYSKLAKEEFQKQFKQDCEVFFVGTGTAANVVALKSILRSYEGVICSDIAHINTAEGGALENFIGAKIFTAPSHASDGKLTLSSLKQVFQNFRNIHFNKPRAVSITQSTELGTVYTCEEIKEICDFAHANGLIVHMDGARIANAAAYLKKTFKEMVVDTGVDILSFGATKNGAIMAEAIVVFNKDLIKDMLYIQKQSMQLFSKMRFIPAQFIPYFKNNLWLKNAANANEKAYYIAEELKSTKLYKILNKVETNQIFIELPINLKDDLAKNYLFYITQENFEKNICSIRIITSYNTSEADAQKLISDFKQAEYNFLLSQSF